MPERTYRPLAAREIELLEKRECTCGHWARVLVGEGFSAALLHRVDLVGDVRLGSASICDARLDSCTVGDGVYIARVGTHIRRYDIEDGARIEDVGVLETRPGASFGNGTEVTVLNESGGREVVLYEGLNAQVAYVMCLHQHRPATVSALRRIAREQAEIRRAGRGRIGKGSVITGIRKLIDVNVGDNATIDGAMELLNGTILSTADGPTVVGAGVQARDFIISESSVVDGGALLRCVFVGQGCRIGKQFSAENSLFFANCEAFHGEAVGAFAGPFTVTHHKSTLLIAGLFSFYNAGSGTNQSNHMYKLGPVHEGKLERGCKTGSFSYLMWPSRVGPFSTVLGKITRPFDSSIFPFSHIEGDAEGRPVLTPGLELQTVGALRDGRKWASRDRRQCRVRRDRINGSVLNPFTVGRMIDGMKALEVLQDSTSREAEFVLMKGITIKRVMLRTGEKTYRPAIRMYLLGKLVDRLEYAALDPSPDAVYSPNWMDVGGLLMPEARLEVLWSRLETGSIGGVAALDTALGEIEAHVSEDEWLWAVRTLEQIYDTRLTEESVPGLLDEYARLRRRYLERILSDAEKEFNAMARTGYGVDGSPEDEIREFEAVRGLCQDDPFVTAVNNELQGLADRVASIKGRFQTDIQPAI